jgi:TetR/AcrR family transcriptional repressor of nem operon
MSTADQILDVAESLIMTGGYNAFSYNDISARLGITTASIHYHFPRKADLGREVVRRYSGRIRAIQQQLDASDLSCREQFDRYLGIFIQVADDGLKICLCGSLAGELISIPGEVQQEVRQFFRLHEQWLQRLFMQGQRRGELSAPSPPEDLARLVFGALEGCLLLARSHQDPGYFQRAVEALKPHLWRS